MMRVSICDERGGALQAGASGAGVVDDFASTIAGFPPDVREEVLMTAEDSVLATLPPSILAEAQVIRAVAQFWISLSRHPYLQAFYLNLS